MQSLCKRHAVVAVLYVLLTVVMTWPATVNLGNSVIGSGGDPWQSMWRFEQKSSEIARAAANGQLSSYIRHELWGGGEARLVNISVWPWMPLHWALGQPLTYNIVWLLSFVMSGLAVYALMTHLLPAPTHELPATHSIIFGSGPFLAGLFYMFLPFHVAHSGGHFGAMQVQWLPLIILLLFLSVRRLSWWTTVSLALITIIQFWTEHHYALWLAIFSLVFLVWYRQEVRRIIAQRRSWMYVSVFLALIVSFGAMPYWPTLRLAWQQHTPLELGRDQLVRFSADLSAFFVPSPFHSLWGNITNELFSRHFTGNSAEATQYLGIIPLLLIVFFHQKVPSRPRTFWAAVFIIFFVISLGPQLHMIGYVLPVYLPFDLFDQLPIFSSVRTVARAGVMVGLAAAILFGWVISSQVRRPANVVLVALLVLIDFVWLPVPVQPVQPSPAYAFLEQQSGSRVIEIPAATNYTIASRALYASGQHRKEVLGNIALERAEGSEAHQIVKSVPGVRQLLYVRTRELRERRTEFFGQDVVETLPDALRWLDVAAVIIHTDSLAASQLRSIRGLVEDAGLIRHSFDDVEVYTASPRGVSTDGIFLMRGEGWANVSFDSSRSSVFAEIGDEASVTILNLNNNPADITLQFGQPPETTAGGEVIFNNTVITMWPAEQNKVSVDLTLAPGENRVIFVLDRAGKVFCRTP